MFWETVLLKISINSDKNVHSLIRPTHEDLLGSVTNVLMATLVLLIFASCFSYFGRFRAISSKLKNEFYEF